MVFESDIFEDDEITKALLPTNGRYWPIVAAQFWAFQLL